MKKFLVNVKDRLLTSMLYANSMNLLSTARDFPTVRESLTLVSVQSKLFRAAKAIFTLTSAREGINLASWLDISSKFFYKNHVIGAYGTASKRRGEEIVYLNPSVFNQWKTIKCWFGLGLGLGLESHRITMYAKTKTNDRRACWSMVGL